MVDLDYAAVRIAGPVRKLLSYVLLLNFVDGSDELVFELGAGGVRITYRVGGKYEEMVPPPAHLAGCVGRELRRIAVLVEPERPRWRLWPRHLARCFGTARPVPRAGWITARLGSEFADMAVRFLPMPGGERVILEPLRQGLLRGSAKEVLERCLRYNRQQRTRPGTM